MVFPTRRRRQPEQPLSLQTQDFPPRSPTSPSHPQHSFMVLPQPQPVSSSLSSPLPSPIFSKFRSLSNGRSEKEGRAEVFQNSGYLEPVEGGRQLGHDAFTDGPSTSTGPHVKRNKLLSFPWKKDRSQNDQVLSSAGAAPPARIHPDAQGWYKPSPTLPPTFPSRSPNFVPPSSPPPGWSLPPVPTVVVSSPTHSSVATSTRTSLANAFSPSTPNRPSISSATSALDEAVSVPDEENLSDLIERWRSFTPEIEDVSPSPDPTDLFALMVSARDSAEEHLVDVDDDEVTPLPTSSFSSLTGGRNGSRSKRDSSRYSGLPYSRDSVMSTPSYSLSHSGIRIPSIHFDNLSMDFDFAAVTEKISLPSTSASSLSHERLACQKKPNPISIVIEEDDGATSSVTTTTTMSSASSRSQDCSTAPTSSCDSIVNKATSSASSIASRSNSSSSSLSSGRSRVGVPVNSRPLARPLPRRTSSRPSPLNIAAANAQPYRPSIATQETAAAPSSPLPTDLYDGLTPSSPTVVAPITPSTPPPPINSTLGSAFIPHITHSSPSAVSSTSNRTVRPPRDLPPPSPVPELFVRPPTPTGVQDGDWEPQWSLKSKPATSSVTTVTKIVVQPAVRKAQIRMSTRSGGGVKRTAPPIRRNHSTPPVPPVTPTTPTFNPYLESPFNQYPSNQGPPSPAFSTSSTVIPVAPLTPKQSSRGRIVRMSSTQRRVDEIEKDVWTNTDDLDEALDGMLVKLQNPQTPPQLKVDSTSSQALTAEALSEHLRRIQSSPKRESSSRQSAISQTRLSDLENPLNLSPRRPGALTPDNCPSRTSQPDVPISEFYRSDLDVDSKTSAPSSPTSKPPTRQGHRRVSSISVEDEVEVSSTVDSEVPFEDEDFNLKVAPLQARDLVFSLSKLSIDGNGKRTSLQSANEGPSTPEPLSPAVDERLDEFEVESSSEVTYDLPEGLQITPPTPSPSHSTRSSISSLSTYSSDSSDSSSSMEDLAFFPTPSNAVMRRRSTSSVKVVGEQHGMDLISEMEAVKEEHSELESETMTRSSSSSTDWSVSTSSVSSGSELGVLTFGERVVMNELYM